MTVIPKTVRDIVDRRAAGSCERCGFLLDGYGAQYSRHHRIPRGSDGSRDPKIHGAANIVLLCGSATSPAGCHLWCESHRDAARTEGFLLYRNQTPAESPLQHRGRWAVLDNDGGIRYLDDPEVAIEVGRLNLAASFLNHRGVTPESMELMKRALDGESIEQLMDGGAGA